MALAFIRQLQRGVVFDEVAAVEQFHQRKADRLVADATLLVSDDRLAESAG
jgi:hypothetical protein